MLFVLMDCLQLWSNGSFGKPKTEENTKKFQQVRYINFMMLYLSVIIIKDNAQNTNQQLHGTKQKNSKIFE